jgi:uncharacterized membrane protein
MAVNPFHSGIGLLHQLKVAKFPAFVLGLALVLIGLGATYGAASVLKSLGFQSIFVTISISDAMKIFISLYLTSASMSLGLSGLALFMISRGRTRQAGWLGIFAAMSAIATVLTGPAFAVNIDILGIMIISAGVVLSLLGGILGFRAPSPPLKGSFLSTLDITNSAVLSALTAILTGIAFVPSPTGGFTHIGDTIILIASLLFGSKVGGLTGVVGSVAADLWVGYPRWFVSIPAHGLEGLIAGLARRRSIPIQIAFCVLGGVVMASVYFYVNIFIKGWALALMSYARDLLGQAGVSIVLAVILTRTLQRLLPRLKA